MINVKFIEIMCYCYEGEKTQKWKNDEKYPLFLSL